MSARDPLAFISLADDRWNSIGGVLGGGIMGVFLASIALTIDFFQATANVLISPLEALGINLGGIVDAFVGGAADIMRQGAETTVASLAPGATWAVGPLTFGFSVIAAGTGLFAMAWLLQQSPTSDLIPFSFTDFPILGVDEGDEEFEE